MYPRNGYAGLISVDLEENEKSVEEVVIEEVVEEYHPKELSIIDFSEFLRRTETWYKVLAGELALSDALKTLAPMKRVRIIRKTKEEKKKKAKKKAKKKTKEAKKAKKKSKKKAKSKGKKTKKSKKTKSRSKSKSKSK